MKTVATKKCGIWRDGKLPANVSLGRDTILTGEHSFQRFCSRKKPALVIGSDCTMDGVHFALGVNARVTIGDYCCFSYSILLCESELQIGSYVAVGWNTTIADTDFHPFSPAQRIADTIACSPLAQGRARPLVVIKPVTIGNDVWIGPNATILKGVRIGAGAFIEPGALVTRDVPPRARVQGNPAIVIGHA